MKQEQRIFFGAFIKGVIKSSPYNQTQIAEKLETSKQTVSNWVTGRDTPSVEKLSQLMRACNFTPYLVVESQNEKGKPIKLSFEL